MYIFSKLEQKLKGNSEEYEIIEWIIFEVGLAKGFGKFEYFP